MNILILGDIFGRPGRKVFRDLLPGLIREHDAKFVIANMENAAGGKGATPKVAEELFESPVDVMTAGNHIWEHETIHPYFDSHSILRPFNVEESLPGRGWLVMAARNGVRLGVVCLQGQVLMDEKGKPAGSPFAAMDKLVPELKKVSDAIIVDFHAEATSEKRALAWYLDGRVTALVGTHTHVQTADEEIMPGGTAYISDLGMTGPHESVIGLDRDIALFRFLTGDKKKFKVAEGGVRLEGVVLEICDKTFRALSIRRIKKTA